MRPLPSITTTSPIQTCRTPTSPVSAIASGNGSAAFAPCGTRPLRRSPRPRSKRFEQRQQRKSSESRAIRACAAVGIPIIEAQAIREGWGEQRTELEILRDTRPGGSAIHVPDNQMTTPVLEAACMMTAGLSGFEELRRARALDSASRRFKGGIGLQELMLEAAWANGYTGRNVPRSAGGVSTTPSVEASQASFSTIDSGGHPVERRQQVPAGRFLQRRAHVAEHLLDPQRERLQDGHQLPNDRQGAVSNRSLRVAN